MSKEAIFYESGYAETKTKAPSLIDRAFVAKQITEYICEINFEYILISC